MAKTNSTAMVKATNIPEGLEAVKAKLVGLELIQTSAFKTGATLMAGFSNCVSKETDTAQLVKMLANCIIREDCYNKAADVVSDVQPAIPAFKLEGYSREDWEADIKLQLKIVNTKVVYDKLNGIKKTLEGLMTDETKFQMAMDELAKI